jgi:hypothetical protein
MSIARPRAREIGTALAVLALYLLTILAPLHHARASQLAFEELGYAALETGWVLCTPDGATGGDGDLTVTKCPAAGAANVLAPANEVPAFAFAPPRANSVVATAGHAFTPAAVTPPSGPRAPPLPV